MNNKKQGIIRPFPAAGTLIGQGTRFADFSRKIMEKYAVSGNYPWNHAVMQFLTRAEEENRENLQRSETIHVTLSLLRIYLNQEQKNRENIYNLRVFLENVRQNIEMNLSLLGSGGGKITEWIRSLYTMGAQLEEEEKKQAFVKLEELEKAHFYSILERRGEITSGGKLTFSSIAPMSAGKPFEHMLAAVSGHSRILNGKELFRRSVERQQKEFYLSMMRDYVVERTESLIKVRLGRELESFEKQIVKDYIGQIRQTELIADIRQNDPWKYEESAGIIFRQLQSFHRAWSREKGREYQSEPDGSSLRDKLRETKQQKTEQELSYVSALREAEKRVYHLGASALESIPELLAQLPEPVYAALSEKTGDQIFAEERSGNRGQALTAIWQTSTLEERRQILNQVLWILKHASVSSEMKTAEKKSEQAELNRAMERLNGIMEYDILCSRLLDSIERQVSLEYLLSENGDIFAPEVREQTLKETLDNINQIENIWFRELPELIMKLPNPLYQSAAGIVAENPGGQPEGTEIGNIEPSELLLKWQAVNPENRRQILFKISDVVSRVVDSYSGGEGKEIGKSSKEQEKLKAVAQRMYEMKEQYIRNIRLLEVVGSNALEAGIFQESSLQDADSLPLSDSLSAVNRLPAETGLSLEAGMLSDENTFLKSNLSADAVLFLRHSSAVLEQTLKETETWVNEVENTWQKELPELIMRLPESVYHTVAEAMEEKMTEQAVKMENGYTEQGEFLSKWQSIDLKYRKQMFTQISDTVNRVINSYYNDQTEKENVAEEEKKLKAAAQRMNQMAEQYARSLSLLEVIQDGRFEKNVFMRQNLPSGSNIFYENPVFFNNIWQKDLPEIIMKLPEMISQTAAMTFAGNLADRELFKKEVKSLEEKLELFLKQEQMEYGEMALETLKLPESASQTGAMAIADIADIAERLNSREILKKEVKSLEEKLELFLKQEQMEYGEMDSETLKLPEPVSQTGAMAIADIAERLDSREILKKEVESQEQKLELLLNREQMEYRETASEMLKLPELVSQTAAITIAERHGSQEFYMEETKRPKQHFTDKKGDIPEEQMVHTVQRPVRENNKSADKSLREITILETRIANQEHMLSEEKHQMEELRKILEKQSDEMKFAEEKQTVTFEKYARTGKLTRKTMEQIKTELRLERIRHGLD
ncbi:MAG: hypothetical protein LBT06_15735 [Hungatella sp.]|nr:hypothetical protein [Hungatella sp.]